MRTLAWAASTLLVAGTVQAQHEGVSSTRHNLSASGPGEIKALAETRVCKFCHIPHNPVVPVPLWGHALSEVRRYEVPRMRRGDGVFEPAPQPDGSSRLCLSCHDGTVALGDIGQGTESIAMAGARRLAGERASSLGTDLSGSHPVSFVVRSHGREDFDSARGASLVDLLEGESAVRLDSEGKMQCTTCHDPHSDKYYEPGRVPRFWVRPTVDEVCLACHALR